VGVSQTAALNRGRHLYLAGRPSRWALAHISSFVIERFLGTQPVGHIESNYALQKLLINLLPFGM